MPMPHIPIPNSAEVFLNLKSQMRMSECRRDNPSDHVPVPAHFPIVYLLALGCFSSSNLRVGYLLEKIIISISFSHERKRFNMCQQDADWAELSCRSTPMLPGFHVWQFRILLLLLCRHCTTGVSKKSNQR